MKTRPVLLNSRMVWLAVFESSDFRPKGGQYKMRIEGCFGEYVLGEPLLGIDWLMLDDCTAFHRQLFYLPLARQGLLSAVRVFPQSAWN